MSRISFLLGIGLCIQLLCCQQESKQADNEEINIAIDSAAFYDSINKDLVVSVDTFFYNHCKNGEFNGTVLFADHGYIIHKKAYGFRSPKGIDSLQIEDQFQLASVSKIFTSTAILQLYQQNKLKLNDTLGKYFPGFPVSGITVEMLLCHRSGLGNYNYFVEDYWPNKNLAIPNDSVIRILIDKQPKPYYLPNKKYDYSNTGYVLLASIVEQVSGKSFEDYLQEFIFLPCDMKNTFVFNKCKQDYTERMLFGYDWKGRRIDDFYQNGCVGDKGVYSTVEDLFKFDRAIAHHKLLADSLWEKAWTATIPEEENPGNNNYGLGWRIKNSYNGYRVVYHTGWWKGFRSYFVRNLTLNKTVIVLDNYKRNGFLSIEQLLDLSDGGAFVNTNDTLVRYENL